MEPRRRRWQRWVAACLLVAIAWPATGALPWIAVHVDRHRVASLARHEHVGAHRHDGSTAQDPLPPGDSVSDSASVPGSPLHPADHDCAECTVLKQLSGTVLPARAAAPLAAHVPPAAPPPRVVTRPRTRFAALPPPVRAPPVLC